MDAEPDASELPSLDCVALAAMLLNELLVDKEDVISVGTALVMLCPDTIDSILTVRSSGLVDVISTVDSAVIGKFPLDVASI